MIETCLYPRFPATSLVSQAEFAEYCRTAQARLDMRHLHEQHLTTHDDSLTQTGTCAPCLRRASFATDTRGWRRAPDGSRLPEWGDAQMCDCEDRLSGRFRALVHFAQSHASLRPWTRLLLFGPPAPADRRLSALAGQTTRLARLDPDGRLDAPDAAFHLLVCADYLDRVPPLRATLSEFRRVLAPGGSAILLLPLRVRAARTASRDPAPIPSGRAPVEARAPVHDIGWDLIDWLRQAGFGHAAAQCYWSNELGYLGAFNMLLHAFG